MRNTRQKDAVDGAIENFARPPQGKALVKQTRSHMQVPPKLTEEARQPLQDKPGIPPVKLASSVAHGANKAKASNAPLQKDVCWQCFS